MIIFNICINKNELILKSKFFSVMNPLKKSAVEHMGMYEKMLTDTEKSLTNTVLIDKNTTLSMIKISDNSV